MPVDPRVLAALEEIAEGCPDSLPCFCSTRMKELAEEALSILKAEGRMTPEKG